MPITNLWIFFPLAITLHNIEEAIWLPEWSKHAGKFHRPVGASEFRFAVIFVTILACLSTFLAVSFPSTGLWKSIFFGFLGTMILNTFIPHLAATVLLRRYSPGLATGLFLIVPVNAGILTQAIQTGSITWTHLLVSTAAVSSILLILLPVFFKLGRSLAEQVK